jgi:hypothetical protein
VPPFLALEDGVPDLPQWVARGSAGAAVLRSRYHGAYEFPLRVRQIGRVRLTSHAPNLSCHNNFVRLTTLQRMQGGPGTAGYAASSPLLWYWRTAYPTEEEMPMGSSIQPRSPMRKRHQVLITGAAVLLVGACAARPTTVARANSDDAAQPACVGETLLVVENNYPRHIEVLELQKTGTAVALASLAPGERTTVRLPIGTENRYEAREVGTNQGIASARYGKRNAQGTYDPYSVRMEVQCR